MKNKMLAFLLAISTVLSPAAAYAAETETAVAADVATDAAVDAATDAAADITTDTTADLAADTTTEAVEPTTEADESWDTTIDPAITDEAQALFEKAAEKLMGVSYEPIAVLATETEASGQEEGEEGKEGVVTTCFLCRANVVYPGAKPYYVLMYVNEAADGTVTVQNIWELWIDAHSEK